MIDILAPMLGTRFGGATLIEQVGVWSADANEYKSQYLPGSTEAGLMISVSVLPQDLEAALQWLQHELARLNDRHNWGLCWIHTEVQAVTARHFSLN